MLVSLVTVWFLHVMSTKKWVLFSWFLQFHTRFYQCLFFYNNLSTMLNSLSRLFVCFFFFFYFCYTANILYPVLCYHWKYICIWLHDTANFEKCRTSTSYIFFLYSSDFLPREKGNGFNISLLIIFFLTFQRCNLCLGVWFQLTVYSNLWWTPYTH